MARNMESWIIGTFCAFPGRNRGDTQARIYTSRFSSPTLSRVSRIKSEETSNPTLIVGISYYFFVVSFE
jgi:hypothetical protein